MKLSVSLPDADVEFLDEYANAHGCPSRSAAVHQAIRSLREDELGEAYDAAWKQWEDSGEAEIWDSATGDGL
ncbi:MAG TPA: ribbon-helix-helix domain-containing protein [Solirubrobacteraceae bacterium]|nr:ribbon-helix-helix domain-containing protein [Solirubrobacteraceae bacterium]